MVIDFFFRCINLICIQVDDGYGGTGGRYHRVIVRKKTKKNR